MVATIQYKNTSFKVDFSKPIDISIPLKGKPDNVNAWYLPPPKIAPVSADGWVGSVAEGADVNFNTIWFSPHAHGTHTECVGHITEEHYSVNRHLTQFMFVAKLITVAPGKVNDDYVITKKQLQNALQNATPEALVVRTLPNDTSKLTRQYGHTNPPYFTEEAATFLREIGVLHLLVDLPSVDKEKDDGNLFAHKAFWDVYGQLRLNATITEFIYVPNHIEDGLYLVNLQIAPFENNASPSKPILYKIVTQ